MSHLLQAAIAAHGGLDRWNSYRKVSLDLSVGGALWDFKGQTGLFRDAHYEAELNAQRAILGRFGGSDQRVRFSPNRLVLETASGEAIETRENPRGAFRGHEDNTPWDRFHAAYFDGYALWTYLTQPFLYSYPGFETVEIEPWEEDGETWRRLRVIFPEDIASHTREQISYFGPDGLLRRHDYAVDVLGGAIGAQYIENYHEHGGILMPRRRRVYPRGPDNRKISEPLLVSIDIGDLHFYA